MRNAGARGRGPTFTHFRESSDGSHAGRSSRGSATGHDYGLYASQPLKLISIILPSAGIKGESLQPWPFVF